MSSGVQKETLKTRLRQLADEITCPVCQEFFREPKILPCFHYYCKQCVVELAAREQPFPCPECRRDTLLPTQGAEGFPTAFFVDRMRSVHSAMEDIQGETVTSSGDLVCQQCHSDRAVSFCRHCIQYVCDFCRIGHSRMKVYSGHVVVSIKELRKNSEENFPNPQPEQVVCKAHQELLKIYCFECNKLICRDCTVKDHKDDAFEFVSKCAPQVRLGLQESLRPLQNTRAQIRTVQKQLEQEKNEFIAQKTHLENAINRSFDEMVRIVEQCRLQMLTTSYKRLEERASAFTAQEKCLGVYDTEIQSLVEFVEHCTERDEEMLLIHKELRHKIEELRHECDTWDLDPAVIPNIDVVIACPDEVKSLIQKSSYVTMCMAEPSMCRAEGPGMEGAETKTRTHLVVHTVYSNGRPCSEKQSVRAELKSMVDGTVVVAEVEEQEKGRYLVSYTADVRGRHELMILVNQQPIAGSPFGVIVEHHPTQLGKPVSVISNINRPYNIALNKNGQLFVTQPEKGAVVAYSNGGMLVSGGKVGLKHPRGIAIGEDGSFLITSGSTEQLMKLKEDWTLLKQIGKSGDVAAQFKGIRSVKISPAHMYYVCEQMNHRVQVFDEDLNHVCSFGKIGKKLGEFNYPTDVAFDEMGQVYVVEHWNHRVQKFSPNNQPLMTFGKRKGELSFPGGIHIRGKFVYVTECGNHRVSVFTTSGALVTSFGSSRELQVPGGISADDDGYIYVCNIGKNQIVVY